MISKLRNSPVVATFLGRGNRNVLRLISIITPNFLAMLLEGVSFGCILLAFTVISGGDYEKNIPLVKDLVHTMTRQQAFIAFTLGAIILQILRSSLTYAARILATALSMRVQIDMQRRIYKQILRFSFPFVSRYKVGDLLDYAQAPSQCIGVVIDAFHSVTVSVFAVLISLGIMFYLSPLLAILAVLLFGFFGFLQKLILKKMERIVRALTVHLVDYSKHLAQSLTALRLIHTFQRQEFSFQRVTKLLGDIGHTTKKVHSLNQIFQPLNEVLGVTFVGIFLLIGSRASFNHQTQDILPLLLTFITIVYRLSGRVQTLVSELSTVTSQWGKILRMNEILSNANKEFASEAGAACSRFVKEIRFENVSLKYTAGTKLALHNVNLSIRKNSTIGFVGLSGAGKSSLLDLLVRLYEPSAGSITFDGKPINLFSLESWRGNMAVVSQDNFIFNETIEENIRFGGEHVTKQDVERAAILANAHNFIQKLPNGYETVVGERGFKLSGGERQRIALARALVRQAEILILDEATSSLDSHSEKLIQESLYKMNHSKTILLVAHRLSTVVHCDIIYVLDEGRVIESGSHQELLKRGGQYTSLWNLQSGTELRQKWSLSLGPKTSKAKLTTSG